MCGAPALLQLLAPYLLLALYTDNLLLVLAACWPIAEPPQRLTTFRRLGDQSAGGKHKQKVVRVEGPLDISHASITL